MVLSSSAESSSWKTVTQRRKSRLLWSLSVPLMSSATDARTPSRLNLSSNSWKTTTSSASSSLMVQVSCSPHFRETTRRLSSVCLFSYPRSTDVVVNLPFVSRVSEKRSVTCTLSSAVNSPLRTLSPMTDPTSKVLSLPVAQISNSSCKEVITLTLG